MPIFYDTTHTPNNPNYTLKLPLYPLINLCKLSLHELIKLGLRVHVHVFTHISYT